MQRLETNLRSIPHLAKNQRDVGHPRSVAGPESDNRAGWGDLQFLLSSCGTGLGIPSSHGRAKGRPFEAR